MIQLQLNQDLTHPQHISLACEGLITVLSVSRCQDGPLVGLIGWGRRGHHAQGSPNPSGDLQAMGLEAERTGQSSWAGSVQRWLQLIMQCQLTGHPPTQYNAGLPHSLFLKSHRTLFISYIALASLSFV